MIYGLLNSEHSSILMTLSDLQSHAPNAGLLKCNFLYNCAALVSPDGVAPSRMVGVSASVNLPLHYKVQEFSSGTGSRGWSRKKGRKQLWCAAVNKTSTNIVHRTKLHRESKKGCHPNHRYNFVSSWSISKILSLLQRAVNFNKIHIQLPTTP